MKVSTIVIFIAGILLTSCTFSKKNKPYIFFAQAGYDFRYKLNDPDKTWYLPHGLAEISGLSYAGNGQLVCNQDEKGNIYLFNTKNGELEKTIKFAGDGDYEAIEITGDDVWVVKSNGNLYHVKNYMKNNKPKVYEYKTPFNEKNNIEGMGFDPSKNRLLIACKGYPFIGKKHKKKAERYKAIYEYNLTTKELNEEPVFLISLDSIGHYKNYNTLTRLGLEISSAYDNAEGEVSFKPSGIAVHPITGNIYVLASVGKALAVLNPEGEMLALIHLDKKIHKQPEGICFSPEGTLYISNEDKGGKGYIMEFDRR